mgnify:FL=1
MIEVKGRTANYFLRLLPLNCRFFRAVWPPEASLEDYIGKISQLEDLLTSQNPPSFLEFGRRIRKGRKPNVFYFFIPSNRPQEKIDLRSQRRREKIEKFEKSEEVQRLLKIKREKYISTIDKMLLTTTGIPAEEKFKFTLDEIVACAIQEHPFYYPKKTRIKQWKKKIGQRKWLLNSRGLQAGKRVTIDRMTKSGVLRFFKRPVAVKTLTIEEKNMIKESLEL